MLIAYIPKMKAGDRMQEFLITVDIMGPLLLTLCVGVLLRRVGLMDEKLTTGMNQLVFRIFLPVLLFNNLRTLNISQMPGLGFSCFLLFGVAGIFLIAQAIVPKFVTDPRRSGVIVQGIFRTNFAILGIPLMDAMFGDAGLAALSLAMPLVVPLNNVLGVVSLSATGGKTSAKKVVLNVITNPLIIAVMLGMALLLTGLKLPAMADEVLGDLAGLTSPVSLLVLGASLKWQGVKENRKALTVVVLLKQLMIPFAMLGAAVLLGFRQAELGVFVILFGAPVAVSSYPMAQAMGGDSQLAASQLVLTTIFSMGTLFLLIYTGKLLGVL